jgi:hypothetical protein
VTVTLLTLLLLAGCGGGGDAEQTSPSPSSDAAASTVPADTAYAEPVIDQTVYVPVYSHIFSQDDTRTVDLAATLSVRNIDPRRSITITRVDYHDNDGRLVRRYLERPLALGPLSSRAWVVAERDRTGGVGANFLVDWEAGTPANPPVVEAVMISTAGTQGISFVSRGQVVASGASSTGP